MFSKDIKRAMRQIFESGIQTVSPRRLVRQELRLVGDRLRVRDFEYRLNRNCYIVGCGKAVLEMGLEAEALLGVHCRGGLLSVPEGSHNGKKDTGLEIVEGARNNIADIKSETAARKIMDLISNLGESDLLLALISGGGSSLLPLPTPRVTLEEKVAVVTLLSKAGADITQMNIVRTVLSDVKGGKLAEKAYPASVLALILSDIVDDPIQLIASGPTVPYQIPPQLLSDIISRYSLRDKIPKSALRILDHHPSSERPPCRVQNILIGNNSIALRGARDVATSLGYFSLVMCSTIKGLVEDLAPCYFHFVGSICKALTAKIDCMQFERECRQFKCGTLNYESCSSLVGFIFGNSVPREEGICLLFGGEPTVKVSGSGKGGRSQELALRFSIEVSNGNSGLDEFEVALLCGGTDGIDGPTDAAGAIAYSGQLKEATDQNIDYQSYLGNNDSYEYYSKLNSGEDHIKIGHTFTNVMDIHILIIRPKKKIIG